MNQRPVKKPSSETLILQLQMRGIVPVFQVKKRGYPDSTVTTGKHRAREIDRETALNVTERRNQQIPCIHPHLTWSQN